MVIYSYLQSPYLQSVYVSAQSFMELHHLSEEPSIYHKTHP